MSERKKKVKPKQNHLKTHINGKDLISNHVNKKSPQEGRLDYSEDITCLRSYYNEVSILFGSVIFAVYFTTLYPTVPGGDSGELIAAAHELGVAHPPGYPLYTLVSWLFIKLLPFGNVAWRVGFQTALSAGISTYCLSLVALRLTDRLSCAIFAVGIWSWSRLTWIWSITAEVFAMNNLFVALLMLLGVYFEDVKNDNKKKVAIIGSIVCGLSLCNQHTMVVYVVFLAIWILSELKNQKCLDTRLLCQLSMCFIAGLTPYIYIPISSLFSNARWTWGDQRTFSGFMKHVLRSEYGTFDLGKGHTGQGLLHGLWVYIQHVTRDLTLLTTVLFCTGVMGLVYRYGYLHTRIRHSVVIYLLMMTAYILFFSWRANLDIQNPLLLGVVERFWMQSDMVIVVIATVALADIISWFITKVKFFERIHLDTVLAVLVAVFQLQRNYKICDNSHNTVVYEFGQEVLRSMPDNAIVLTKGDLPSNIFRYLYLCEDIRHDLQIFDQEVLTYEWSVPMLGSSSPKIKFPGDYLHPLNRPMHDGKTSFNFERFLDVNYENYAIFGCIGVQEHEKSWQQTYELLPYGPCYQFIKKGHKLNLPLYINQTIHIAQYWKYPYSGFDETSWERVATDEMWNAQISSAFYLYELSELSQNKGDKSDFIVSSYKLYSAAIDRHKTIPAYWHKNYALVCERMLHANHNLDKSHLLYKSVQHFEQFLEIEPNDPDKEAIKDAIKMLKEHIRLIQQ